MRRLLTLLLTLVALSTFSERSDGQTILSQNFDNFAYYLTKPPGWTDSIFTWQYYSQEPLGYPLWFVNLPSGCSPLVNGTYYYYYYPVYPNYVNSSYDHPGPYGTTIGYDYAYAAPASHTTQPGVCQNSGVLTYSTYYNGDANYANVCCNSKPAFDYHAEIATPKMNFVSGYSGVGSIRLTFWVYTYYYGSAAYNNRIYAYINNVPVSAGGVLLDSILPFANPAYGSTLQWTKFQYTLPTSYYTSNSAYIIFKGQTTMNTTCCYFYYDLNIDDVLVEYVPPCPVPTAQPTNLQFSTSASIVSGSFNAVTAAPVPTGYIVIRTPTGVPPPLPVNSTTYTVGQTLGLGTIAYVGPNTSFLDPNLASSTNYNYAVYSYSSGPSCSINYDLVSPLINNVTTGSVNIYTWNQTNSGNWQTPTNWTPSRVVPDPTDILVFDNGTQDTCTSVLGQPIGKISMSNNTSVRLRASSGTGILNLNNNAVPGATGLDIAAGSSMVLDATVQPITLSFGAGSAANINGNLEVANTSVLNQINFTNVAATVGANGSLAAGGTNNNYPFLGVSPTTLIFNGTYNHKYTTVGGGAIPNPAQWNTGSQVLISGYTTATTGPAGGLNQQFYNFTYNCPSQTANNNWTGQGPVKVLGTLNISSTGTGAWQLATTQVYSDTINNFVQAGGTLDLATGTNAGANNQVLNIGGTFTQTGGVIKSTGLLTTAPILYFNAQGAVQNVTLSNSPTGPIVYRVGNPFGINLTGINALSSTPLLTINNGGGVRISTTAANPINTALSIAYANLGSTLTYDTTGNITATTSVFPPATSSPPYNLVINVGTGNAVTLPFSATVAGVLTFTSGDLNIANYALTVGTGTLSTNLGTIYEPFPLQPGNGNVRVTTGSLTRWFGTAGLPVSAATPAPINSNTQVLTSQGFYPLSFGASNRNATVYFSAANALAGGGTITVTHTPTTGLTTASVTDNTPTYLITNCTNANWNFTIGNGLTPNTGGTFGLRLTAGNLISPINTANLRILHATTIPGTYVPGSGSAPNFNGERNALLNTDLTSGPWYMGANSADINTGTNGVYTQTSTGPWTTAGNWDVGAVPGINNIAVINPGVISTIASGCNAKSLTVLGTFNDATGSSLTIDSSLVNNGVMNVTGGTLALNTNPLNNPTAYNLVGLYNYGAFTENGGTITMGSNGVNNKPFANYATFTLTSGNLNINGSFNTYLGSTFTQRGGTMSVDGNAGGNITYSVPHGRAIVSFQTPYLNLYGGNITIVDPDADNNASPSSAFEYNLTSSNPAGFLIKDSSAHTITFGDGVSTDPGGTPFGFQINTYAGFGRFNFGTLVVNSATGINRAVTTTQTLGVQSNMTINSGEFQTSNQNLYLNGNLTVNANGRFTTDLLSTLYFGQVNYAGALLAAAPATRPQTLSGSGVFINSGSTLVNLNNITVMSPPYVYFNTGSNVKFPSASAITFKPVNNVPSRIVMAPGTSLAENGALATSNNASATNGWVVGAYSKHVTVGTSMVAANYLFPIGDSINYTPVTVASTTLNVVSGGDVTAFTTPGNVANIATSSLNPLKTVMRNYTINASQGTVFTPNSITTTLNWVPSDVSAGANYLNFKVAQFANGTWYYPHTTGNAATSIRIDTQSSAGINGVYQVGEGCPPIVISAQPQSQGVCSNGTPLTLSVTATGASITYQWYKNGVVIPGANNPIYTITSPGLTDSGHYYVVISSICTAPVTSSVAVVTAGGPPPILTQPLSAAVCAGYPVTTCVVAGGSGLTYRWQRNQVDIPGAPNAPCFTIAHITPFDTGSIRVIVSNTCASDTSLVAHLSINPLPPASISTTAPLSFCSGGNVLLSANIAPGYTYQYFQNGVGDIAGATNSTFPATAGGRYGVRVTDANNCTSTSNLDSVTVFPAPADNAPNVIGQTTFCQGGTVQLLANPQDPTYNYQWQLNGVNVAGATLASYNPTASGNYSVAVVNPLNCRAVSPSTLVTVLAIPSGVVVANGPTSLCNGSSVTLSAPTGTGYVYQWYNNTTSISGATSSTYNTSAAGFYKAVISNGYCADTTAGITVTVDPLPANTVTPSGATTFCTGGSVTLSAGTGNNLTYQWMNGANNVAGATNATYTALTSGSYSVTIQNAGGCTETTTPVNVVVNALPLPIVTSYENIVSTQSIFSTYQWYFNNTPVAGVGTNSKYTASQNGTYTVYVTDANGCSNMSTPYILKSVGVTNVAAANTKIRVYPNPAHAIVYIDAPVSVNVSVNSVDGKELFSQNNAKSIDISALANGVYMIKITDQNGNMLSVEKLVKTDN